jgi:glycosyltransferase involved in cell wall biosynthesis
VKDEIVHYCRIAPERVRVTYLAPAECFRPVEDQAALSVARRQHLGGDVPFFLFVGKTTGRRSLPTVIEGFAALKRTTALPHRLVLVGRGTDSDALRQQAGVLGVSADVISTGFLADTDVNLLYNAATALVSGAVYETNSLPVMEAQATGLPVICFRNPGMVEITAGAAMLLDVVDPASLCGAMVAMAEDEGLRMRLREDGLASAARFSWDRCARETMTVLEDAATA